MKVWESGEREVVLKRDTDRYDRQIREMNAEIQRIIEEEWPDITTTWDRRESRCRELCVSTEAKDWQCGLFGPDGRFCHRLLDHRGKCSDLFTPADRKTITKRLKEIKHEELAEVLGKTVRDIGTRKFDAARLRKILREEGS